MAEMDKGLLKELGLTNNEIEVYLKLLASGSVSVNTIAERTGLHRQACYDALDRLLEKGFVNFVVKDGKKHFQALPPERLVHYADELRNRLMGMVPELERMAKAGEEKTFVEVYKGKNTLRMIFRDVVNTLREKGGEFLVTGVEEGKFLEYDKPGIERYIENMKKWELKEKLLAVEGAEFLFPGPQSEYRFLPKDFFNPNPTCVYGDKVVFIIWGTPLYAVMIANKEVADANRKQFNLLWKIAKKVKKETRS